MIKKINYKIFLFILLNCWSSIRAEEIDIIKKYDSEILLMSSETHANIDYPSNINKTLTQTAQKICQYFGYKLKSFILKDFDENSIDSMFINKYYYTNILEINGSSATLSHKKFPIIKHKSYKSHKSINYIEMAGYGLSLVSFTSGNVTASLLYFGIIDGVADHNGALKTAIGTVGITFVNILIGVTGSIYRKIYKKYNEDLEMGENIAFLQSSYALPIVATSIICEY